jgi:hypothetical protein
MSMTFKTETETDEDNLDWYDHERDQIEDQVDRIGVRGTPMLLSHALSDRAEQIEKAAKRAMKDIKRLRELSALLEAELERPLNTEACADCADRIDRGV